jgi:penicillin-binding protein 1A
MSRGFALTFARTASKVLQRVQSTRETAGRNKRFASRIAVVLMVCAGLLGLCLVLAIGLALYLGRVATTLPDVRSNPDDAFTQRTTIVYAADGTLLAEWHGEQDRTVVGYDQMPGYLRDAVVAAEDRRFYAHHGIDVEGILRAFSVNTAAGRVEQGGSTITQQVVKNLFFANDKRTMPQKIREALMANALEARADKNKVLKIYLNTIYFGRGYYGLESASKHYFGKHASALTLSEAATLAGIIRSPTRLNPVDNLQGAKDRRDTVLDEMAAQGYISTATAATTKAEALVVAAQEVPPQRAPYFVEYVKQELIDKFGAEKVYTGGLRVYTTLDPTLQAVAESASHKLNRPGDPEVALVAIRHRDGRVLAMVGGRDFAQCQFNLAAQGHRQPGSAFKPFVLATALASGIRPVDRFSATPYKVRVKDGVWNVQNFENEITKGTLSLSTATQWSVNAVFARLIMRVGPSNVVATAQKMGITTPLQPDPAIALGGLRTGVTPLEMASAYGTIANGGLAVHPSGVERVLDDRGQVVYQPKRAASFALSPRVAATESSMLHNVVEQGTAVKAKIGQWAAGKTGTTQSYRDAWFVGWSGDVATAVWVGSRDGQVPMTNVHGIRVTGGSFPAEIWSAFMNTAARPRPAVPSAQTVAANPAQGTVLARVCEESMLLANPRCPNTIELYLPRMDVPTKTCAIH